MEMKEFLKVAEDFNEEIMWRADLLRSVKYPKEKGYYPYVVSGTSNFGATVIFKSIDIHNPIAYFDIALTLRELTCDKEVISRLLRVTHIRQNRVEFEAEINKKNNLRGSRKAHFSYLIKQLEKYDEE